MKQFAPACERNKLPILAVLREVLPAKGAVLEVGSGTGQHAAFFAFHFPDLTWQPTDLATNLASIEAWRAEAGLANLLAPIELDLFAKTWPISAADAVVCINTIHIISWEGVRRLFRGVAKLLTPGGVMFVYGPYRYRRRALEPSNIEFDRWLKARDPASGVREFETVDELAREHGLRSVSDRAMPANNRSIWWVKSSR